MYESVKEPTQGKRAHACMHTHRSLKVQNTVEGRKTLRTGGREEYWEMLAWGHELTTVRTYTRSEQLKVRMDEEGAHKCTAQQLLVRRGVIVL